jgi:hypothetical protein
MSLFEALPDGRADVGVGAALQQEAREPRFVRLPFAVIDPEVPLRDDRRVQRSVAAEPVRVDCRPHVGIHAPVEQPLRDLQLVEICGDVEERRSVDGRPLRGVAVPGARGSEQKDVGDVERACEEIWIAREVRVEQVDAAAMERHDGRVGRLEAVLDVHLQDAVLRGRVPAVGPEQVLHRVAVHAIGPDEADAEREQDGGAFDAQRVRGTGERQPLERRPPPEVINQVHRLDLALERGASGRRHEIFGAIRVQETDDAVASKVRRVRHRRTPVAVGADQNVFLDQRPIPRDEFADRVRVIAPDRVRELHRLDESRPARRTVAPCERELRVGQLRGSGVDRFGIVLAHVGDRLRVGGVDGAQEFLGLTMKLIEVGPDGQAADGHDEPPSVCPWSAGVGQGGSVNPNV